MDGCLTLQKPIDGADLLPVSWILCSEFTNAILHHLYWEWIHRSPGSDYHGGMQKVETLSEEAANSSRRVMNIIKKKSFS